MPFPKIDDTQLDFVNWGNGFLDKTIRIGENVSGLKVQIGPSTGCTLTLPGESTLDVRTIKYETITVETTEVGEILADTLRVRATANIGATGDPASLHVFTGYPPADAVETFTIDEATGNVTVGAGNVTISAGTLTVSAGMTTLTGGLTVNGGTFSSSILFDLNNSAQIAGSVTLDGATGTAELTTAVDTGELRITTGAGNIVLNPAGTDVQIGAGKRLKAQGGIDVSGAALTVTGYNVEVTNGVVKVDGKEIVAAGGVLPYQRDVLTPATLVAKGTSFVLSAVPRAAEVNTRADTVAQSAAGLAGTGMLERANMRVYVNGQLVRNWQIDDVYTDQIVFDEDIQANSEVVVEYLKD
jgi:hypothetical protein